MTPGELTNLAINIQPMAMRSLQRDGHLKTTFLVVDAAGATHLTAVAEGHPRDAVGVLQDAAAWIIITDAWVAHVDDLAEVPAGGVIDIPGRTEAVLVIAVHRAGDVRLTISQPYSRVCDEGPVTQLGEIEVQDSVALGNTSWMYDGVASH